MNNQKIYFAKVDATKETIIPTKRVEDAGFDIYANFDEQFIIINPHETKMIPTNLASAFSNKYVVILKERGSTGSKGIAQRCGVIDSGYRGEYFIPLTNTNDKPLVILKDVSEASLASLEDDYIVYPYSKAICQAILVPVPEITIEELSYNDLLKFESERGTGCLGASGK